MHLKLTELRIFFLSIAFGRNVVSFKENVNPIFFFPVHSCAGFNVICKNVKWEPFLHKQFNTILTHSDQACSNYK